MNTGLLKLSDGGGVGWMVAMGSPTREPDDLQVYRNKNVDY